MSFCGTALKQQKAITQEFTICFKDMGAVKRKY